MEEAIITPTTMGDNGGVRERMGDNSVGREMGVFSPPHHTQEKGVCWQGMCTQIRQLSCRFLRGNRFRVEHEKKEKLTTQSFSS